MTSSDYSWIFVHFLPSLGFVLALVLLSRILTERRSPASTMAWFLAIVFVPYLAVPLYLMFGGRKMEHLAQSKPMLPREPQVPIPDERRDTILISPEHHGVFPLTSGNTWSLLPTGEEAFAETIRLIEGAEKTIHIATFILGRGVTGKAIVEALAKKAKEGVEVRLLLDALGCIKVTRGFLAPLIKAGGKFAFFMPMMHIPFRGRANLRIHRKMLIVDGHAGVMGGMNLAEEYMGPVPFPDRWRDLSVSLEGPIVAHLNDIFRSDWKFASGEELPGIQAICRENRDNRDMVAQLMASGPDVREDSLHDAIVTALFKAKRRVWVVTPYFVPDEVLIKSLCIAARRGVDITIILPARSNHALADLARGTYLAELDEAGGTIMFYQPGMLHAKALIVDDEAAAIGSANMDMRSLMLNYEVALWVYSPSMIMAVDRWMGWLLSQCSSREVKKSRWRALFQGFGRLLAPLL